MIRLTEIDNIRCNIVKERETEIICFTQIQLVIKKSRIMTF